MSGLDAWWAAGEHQTLAGHRVFVRVVGTDGPWTTYLHGFPTSSYDWAPLLAKETSGRHLTLDFLGFGASAKPKGHRYRLTEQADIVQAAWAAHGIEETRLVSHDYGVSVGQELLARDGGPRITEAAFLNGGLFPHLHRALPKQKLLAGPAGVVLTHLATEKTFTDGLKTVMAIHPSDEELHEHWRAFSRDGGARHAHRLLGYIAERKEHRDRWERALTQTPEVPKRFVWGPEDPVSGKHVLPELARRLPDAPVHVLDGVGHYPQLEATDRVAEALAA